MIAKPICHITFNCIVLNFVLKADHILGNCNSKALKNPKKGKIFKKGGKTEEKKLKI